MKANYQLQLTSRGKLLIGIISVFISISALADGECTRHLYNTTNSPQQIVASAGVGGVEIDDAQGNVVCAGDSCNGSVVQSKVDNSVAILFGGVFIPAQTAYTIYYKYSTGGEVEVALALSGEGWYSTGEAGDLGLGYFYATNLSGGGAVLGQCPYIPHPNGGNTGLPSLNQSANGDVTW